MIMTIVKKASWRGRPDVDAERDNAPATSSTIFSSDPKPSPPPVTTLTEEEQIKIAQRIGLIQHLPTGTYDGCKKNRE